MATAPTTCQPPDPFDSATLKQACIDVAKSAGGDIVSNQIEVLRLRPGHPKPSDCPTHLVYIFLLSDKALKVGNTDDKTGKRISDNYNLKKPGTLAYNIWEYPKQITRLPDCSQEIKADIERLQREWAGCEVDTRKKHMRSWMQEKLGLVILKFDKKTDGKLLDLIEQHFQCSLKPVFEGDNQGYKSAKRDITQEEWDRKLAKLAATLMPKSKP